MNATPATDAKSSDAAPKYAPQTKLSVVHFHGSVMFGTEMLSASVAKTGGNCVDLILPGIMLADGTLGAVPDGQRGDGLILRKKIHDLHNGSRKLAQTLVPWANIKSVGYSE